MSKQKYLTVIEAGPESFGAFAPDIAGCVAFTKDRDKLTLLVKLAAEAHLLELAEAGEELPSSDFTELPGLTVGVPSGAITLVWTEVDLPVSIGATH